MASGKLQTVLGLINPDKIGITLPHEHISLDFRAGMVPPRRKSDLKTVNMNEISLRNVGWIRQNAVSHPFSLAMVDEPAEDIIAELNEFKKEGGCTIVDNTTPHIDANRNVELQKKVSIATGLNFICGTGHYVDSFTTEAVKCLSVEELANTMVKEITVGVDNTGIKCGIIGEIGCSWPVTPFEKKSLQATAMAQADTGAPVMIHPGRNEMAPFEHIRILQEAGGDINKTVIAHIDRTIFDHKQLLELAATGCYIEYDLFGVQHVHYDLNPAIDMPSDSQRVKEIKFLVDEGFEDQILISHDIHARHHLLKYGGHGYCHIQVNIIPKMLQRGISQEVIDKIQIANPRRWLTFK